MVQPDFQQVLLAGLEAAVFEPESFDPDTVPVVFVIHGLGGAMHHTFGICRDLASAGMVAIAVDQRNHGRRLVDLWRNLSECNPHYPVDTFAMYLGTARDVSGMIEFLPVTLGLAGDRIGVTGVSLGGHASFLLMSEDPRIKVAVPLIGTGNRRWMLDKRLADSGLDGDDQQQAYPPALFALLDRYDPIRHPGRFADRPLLMINGGADTIVPAQANAGLYQVLAGHYSDPDRLVLSIHEDVGHEVTEAMRHEMVQWFSQWL